jgi:hypothetical protein
MGIPIKPSRYLTAKRGIAIKKGGHAHEQLLEAHLEECALDKYWSRALHH